MVVYFDWGMSGGKFLCLMELKFVKQHFYPMILFLFWTLMTTSNNFHSLDSLSVRERSFNLHFVQISLSAKIKMFLLSSFFSYCSVGQPWSYDMDSGFKRIACSLLERSLCSRKLCDESYFFGNFII